MIVLWKPFETLEIRQAMIFQHAACLIDMLDRLIYLNERISFSIYLGAVWRLLHTMGWTRMLRTSRPTEPDPMLLSPIRNLLPWPIPDTVVYEFPSISKSKVINKIMTDKELPLRLPRSPQHNYYLRYTCGHCGTVRRTYCTVLIKATGTYLVRMYRTCEPVWRFIFRRSP